jgi:micrococcal nuclease
VSLLLMGYPSLAFSGQFRVTRVHDGETIRAEGHGVEIVVRLAGIEIPETPQHGQVNNTLSLEAKSYLAEMTLNKVVEIEGHGMDEINRVLGVVYISGMNVNLKMIKAGYAKVYSGNPPQPLYLLPYLKAQQIAKRARRGIWSDGKDLINSRRY